MGNCQMCETDSGVTNEAEMISDKEKYIGLLAKDYGFDTLPGGVDTKLSSNHPVHAITRKANEINTVGNLQELLKRSIDIIGQTRSGSSELKRMKPIVEVIEKAPSTSTLHECASGCRVIQNCAAALLKLTFVLVKNPDATAHQHIEAVSDTTHSIRQYFDEQCLELSYLITANEEYNRLLEGVLS